MSSVQELFTSLKDVTDESVIRQRLFVASLSALSGQQLRDIWAGLSGRSKGLKSSGKFSNKSLLCEEIYRLLMSHASAAAAAAASVSASAKEAPETTEPVTPTPSVSEESTTSSGKKRAVIQLWKERVYNGEEVVLTRHESGVPDREDLARVRLYIVKEGEAFRGFLNRETNTLYKSPSAACRAHLTRDGETNQWRGPAHCLVVRTGIYTPLNKL